MIIKKRLIREYLKKVKHKLKTKHGIEVDIEKKLIVVFFILIISLTALIGIVVRYKSLESKQLGPRLALTKFWIPCDDLSLSLDEDAETFDGSKNSFKHFVDTDGTSICLFDNLTEIVLKKVERISRIRLAKGLTFKHYQSCGNPDLAPDSGYMTALLSKLSNKQPIQKDQQRNQMIDWDIDSNYSFAGTGVTFNKRRIQITEDNFYFVYAIISFNNTIGNGDCGSCMFRVSIYKTNVMYDGSYESRELQERETLCNRTTGVSSLYIGSHIYLDKGDIIYVKVSDVSRLDVKSAGNGFGLFPLP